LRWDRKCHSCSDLQRIEPAEETPPAFGLHDGECRLLPTRLGMEVSFLRAGGLLVMFRRRMPTTGTRSCVRAPSAGRSADYPSGDNLLEAELLQRPVLDLCRTNRFNLSIVLAHCGIVVPLFLSHRIHRLKGGAMPLLGQVVGDSLRPLRLEWFPMTSDPRLSSS
jgi:hypothetical protein